MCEILPVNAYKMPINTGFGATKTGKILENTGFCI